MAEKDPFQFPLSALLWLMVYVSITCSIVMIFVSRRRADDAGKAAVEELGGDVYEFMTHGWEDDFWVDLRGTNLTDEQLIALAPKLKNMTYVSVLMIDSPNITREVLPHLRGFSNLFALHMNGTAIPSEEVRAFALEEGINSVGSEE